jgi:poly(beta-D-mannuronate) lyase
MNIITVGIALAFFLFGNLNSCHSQLMVTTQTELNNAINTAVPGSIIILKNQVWTDVVIDIEKKGTSNLPIQIKAETNGQVYFEGNSSVHLGGEYLLFEGVVFQNPQNLVVSSNRIDPIIEFRSKG